MTEEARTTEEMRLNQQAPSHPGVCVPDDQSHVTRYTGPVIDAHIHLYDPLRPGGILWPRPGDVIYGQRLASQFWENAAPHRVVGAIVVESSPRVEDNQWLLDTVVSDERILGFIGSFDPASVEFMPALAALQAEPRFLGIRYGNLWQRDLMEDQKRPGFMAGIRSLASLGRCLESANPDLRLIQALLKLLGAIPELRVVVDHLPNANVSPADRRAYDSALRELASHPLCYAKLAEIPQKRAHAIPDAVVNHKISVITDRDYYNGRLDALWGLFGNERCFFGSDWPNSDALMGYSETFELVAQCADRHPLNAQQKFFYDNAFNAYSLRLAR